MTGPGQSERDSAHVLRPRYEVYLDELGRTLPRPKATTGVDFTIYIFVGVK